MLKSKAAPSVRGKQLAPSCFRSCFPTRKRNYKLTPITAAMSGIVHGLCVWPAGALPIALAGFHEVLPTDLTKVEEWVAASPRNVLTAIIAQNDWDFPLMTSLRKLSPTCFIVVWHPEATEDPMARITAFNAGANMVTNDEEHLQEAIGLITTVRGTGKLMCPWCGLAGLSTLELWQHQPLYHIYEPDKANVACPACRSPNSRLTRHINLYHGPTPGVDERTGVFALAIIRRPGDGKFLLVQERYREGYWVPGGGVDSGESLRQGVVREAREEAGVDITVTGILTVESLRGGAWRRIIFLAEPLPPSPALPTCAGGPHSSSSPAAAPVGSAAVAGGPPAGSAGTGTGAAAARYRCKTLPDVESAGACWVRAEEVAGLPLRCPEEPLTWIPYVAGGGRVWPLDPGAVPQLGRVFPDFPL